MEIIASRGDFDTSVRRAMKDIDKGYEKYPGFIIVGSHSPKDIETKIEKINFARLNKVPMLGICMGMQLMAIEYARNVLGIRDANTEELKTGTYVVTKMQDLRVGIREAEWRGNIRNESHWHNYMIDNEIAERMEFDGWDIARTHNIVEVIEAPDHPFFVGVQFHPEYQSTRWAPHPVLVDFLRQCKKTPVA